MRVASVVFKERDFMNILYYSDVVSIVNSTMKEIRKNKIELIVFPALLGCIIGDWKDFIEDILRISLEYKNIYICPGSFYEDRENRTYHSSCIVKNGRIILRQRQLHLSRWEKAIELSRGNTLEVIEIGHFKTAIILSTDAFYPQVSRYAAAKDVNLVLSPMAIKKGKGFPFQLSGVWNAVQANNFSAIESGFKGEGFFSYSAIHIPQELTDRDRESLILEKENNTERIIMWDLSETSSFDRIKRTDIISKLNRHIYMDMIR